MKTIPNEVAVTLAELSEIYSTITGGLNFEDYTRKIWKGDTPNGDKVALEFNSKLDEIAESDIPYHVEFCCIEISCDFCVQAMRETKVDLAWSYVVKANFWRDMLKHIHFDSKILSDNARKAGLARAENSKVGKALKEIEAEFFKVKDQFKRRGYSAEFG